MLIEACSGDDYSTLGAVYKHFWDTLGKDGMHSSTKRPGIYNGSESAVYIL